VSQLFHVSTGSSDCPVRSDLYRGARRLVMNQLLHFARQFHRPHPAIRLQPIQPLLVQSEYALPTEGSGDLARGSAAQFLGSGHLDLRLRILVFDTFQPTAEPFVRRQATRLVVSVTVVSF